MSERTAQHHNEDRVERYKAFRENWDTEQALLREEAEKSRLEHEKMSREYLAKAESTKTVQELYELFDSAEFWDQQKDLIEWAGKSKNQRSLDFLSLVVKNSETLPKEWGKNEKFYTHQDYYLDEAHVNEKLKAKAEPRWKTTTYEWMQEADMNLVDYEEYLLREASKALGNYNSSEFRQQAEGILLLERDLRNPFDVHDPYFWAWLIMDDWLKHGVRLDLDELAALIGPVDGLPSQDQVERVKKYLKSKHKEGSSRSD